MHDRKLTEWQKTLDQDHKRIYTHAAVQSITPTTKHPGNKASTPSKERKSLSSSAPSPGNLTNIGGNPIEAGTTAADAVHVCIRA